MRSPERFSSLLGLAARAGGLIYGTDLVRQAARAGRVRLVVVATDTSDNTRDKLEGTLGRQPVPWIRILARAELGAAVGRAPLSAVGVSDAGFAARLQALAAAADEAGERQ